MAADLTQIRVAAPARFVAAVVASIFSFWAATANSTVAQAFNPIHALTSWYTDRNLVDIEIVGSTSMLPEFCAAVEAPSIVDRWLTEKQLTHMAAVGRAAATGHGSDKHIAAARRASSPKFHNEHGALS
jgi:hypothetical protein